MAGTTGTTGTAGGLAIVVKLRDLESIGLFFFFFFNSVYVRDSKKFVLFIFHYLEWTQH